MAGEHRAAIQKGQRYIIFEDDIGWSLAPDNLAKRAILS
jgi:hypothetical protein